MSFGFGFGLPRAPLRGRPLVAAIRSLFAANEPGVWYDPSDLSTLFQDAAGTTPVTAVEQPVGLMLDKSKGLTLGPELVTNGTFDTNLDGWLQPNGIAWSWVYDGAACNTTTNRFLERPLSLPANTTVLFSFEIKQRTSGRVRLRLRNSGGTVAGFGFVQDAKVYSGVLNTGSGVTVIDIEPEFGVGFVGTIDNISVRELPGNHAYQTTATSRPVLSARVNQYLATEMLATQNVTTLAAQYLLSFEGTGTITLSGTATGVYSAGSHLITCTAGTLTSTVSGSVTKADLRVANDGANLPPYQRVNTATDYDTVRFPHYLRFDGVDDFLVTPTITPGTDKVQVFAGARKLSDAAAGVLLELGTGGVSRSFQMVTSGLAGDASRRTWVIGHEAGGAELQGGAATFPAPDTRVLTGSYDRAGTSSGTQLQLRLNTAPQSLVYTSVNLGTGNYLAYPLYIGRRGDIRFPFNGRLYSLIVRFGSNLPAATIEKTEKYINTKTRAY